MKIRLKSTGEVVEAKRFKDMSEEEKRSSFDGKLFFKNDNVFMKFDDYVEGDAMLYLYDDEYEVIEESNKLATTEINIDYYEELKAKADKWDKKETPFKPNALTLYNYGYCKCSSYITSEDDKNYCSDCGQKLDWSESED